MAAVNPLPAASDRDEAMEEDEPEAPPRRSGRQPSVRPSKRSAEDSAGLKGTGKKARSGQ